VEFLSTTGERMAPTVPLLPTPVVPAVSSRGGSVKSTHCPLRLRVPPSLFGGIIFLPRRTTYPPPSPASSTPSPSPPVVGGDSFWLPLTRGLPPPLFYCVYPLNNRGVLLCPTRPLFPSLYVLSLIIVFCKLKIN